MLAKIIALRNTNLSQPEINFAVQCTIDRILFLRMCEDRGIERYGQLQSISSGDRTYPRLCEIFERADQKYNSGLFHFHLEPGRTTPPDTLTPSIAIDDKDLKWILYNLYYPQCPYEFSVLPPEILGNVYEQFLGKIITLTPAHHAKIEDKPEVKKAGGVYYTPSYIVDYIVKNTVGNLLNDPAASQPRLAPTVIPSAAEESIQACHSERSEESHSSIANRKSKIENHKALTPKQIENIKILDPACGSGSFLLGAYTYLLNYHRDWYSAHDPEKWMRKKNPPIYQVPSPPSFSRRRPGGSLKAEGLGDAQTPVRHCEERSDAAISNYRLTIAEKKRILLNNIFGVDIDSQAVEVTKLSLLLKVLEGENSQTLENQYRLFHERALPDLASNIKCGNSLIAPDFFDNNEQPTTNNELYAKINPFDWKQEFPHIFARKNSKRSGDPPVADGFDAVIGNPPYVHAASIVHYKPYFESHYATYSASNDLYTFFIEQSLNLLSKHGIYSMIVSNKWLRADYGRRLRDYVSQNTSVHQLLDFGELPVFHGVGTFPSIIVASHRATPNPPTLYAPLKAIPPETTLEEQIATHGFTLDLTSLPSDNWTLAPPAVQALLAKIASAGVPMGSFQDLKIRRGVLTGYNPAFIIDEQTKNQLIHAHASAADLIKPFVSGDEVRRYSISWRRRYVIFTHRGIDISSYPSIRDHLSSSRTHLEPKKAPRDKLGRKPGPYKWYEIQDSTNYHPEFAKPKIVYGQFQIGPHFAFSSSTLYFGSNHYMLLHDDTDFLLQLCGILNSKLYFFYMKHIAGILGDPNKRGRLISQKSHILKFPIPSFADTHHSNLLKFVEQMLNLHSNLAAVRVPDEKTKIQRQIDTTDRQIDQLVYKLYNLTEEEIKIVELTIR
jgi:hypothetical protein